jgi:hypothetical protein
MDRLKSQSTTHGIYSLPYLLENVNSLPKWMGGLMFDTYLLTHHLTLAVAHDATANGRSNAKKPRSTSYHFTAGESDELHGLMTYRKPLFLELEDCVFVLQPLSSGELLGNDDDEFDPDL